MCPLLHLSLAEPDSAFAGTAWKAVTQGEGAEVCARSAKTKLSKIISQATPKAPLRVLPWPTKILLQSTAKHTDVHSPPAETICTVNRTWSGGESNAVNVQELQVLNFTLYLTMQSLFLHRLHRKVPEWRSVIWQALENHHGKRDQKPEAWLKDKWDIRTTAKTKGIIRKILSGMILKKDHCCENWDHGWLPRQVVIGNKSPQSNIINVCLFSQQWQHGPCATMATYKALEQNPWDNKSQITLTVWTTSRRNWAQCNPALDKGKKILITTARTMSITDVAMSTSNS